MNLKVDKDNMYEAIYNFPSQIEKSFNIINKNCFLTGKQNFDNVESIMILGMGGSAISGLLIKEILNNEINIPIHVNQNYIIPKWVNEKTLIIASSYSGNTEETLISSKECIKKKM